MSFWSVDAIQRGARDCIVRLVKYHPDVDRNVGMRYIHADPDALSRESPRLSVRVLPARWPSLGFRPPPARPFFLADFLS
jgi:hypothetical protein